MMMKLLPNRTTALAALFFMLGIAAARLPLAVGAAATPLEPAVIELGGIGPDALPPPNGVFPNLRSKTLVATDGMTAALQIGMAAKHFHADANEVQIVIEGSGTEWLANRQVAIKPGTLIVIPKGTPHAGQIESTGHLKLLSIKTPPQDPADVHLVP